MNTKKTRIEKQEMSWMNGDRSSLTQTDVNRHKSTGTNSCNYLVPECLTALVPFRKAAFTLTEGRLACTTTQAPAKAQRCQYVIASECEAIQPIEKAGLEQQNTGLIHVKNLFPYFLNPLFPCKRCAFTLAEVLITLAVIGIVAALTLPGLIQNHNEKAWSTAKDLWEKKLTETVRRMNVDGVMTGHNSTEDFMNTFKNYMKVIKTCDNGDINKCYSPKIVTTGKDDAPLDIETETLTSASSMGLKEWQTNTNTMSFVVADGTTVIMAYQPECPYADPIEDTGSQVSCMAYMVDVNGKKGPNRVGKDIELSSGVAFSTCDNPIGDMCWSTEFQANRAIDTCDGSEYEDLDSYGSENDYCANNYWAGAKLSCQEKGMELPTRAQLAQLASELYVNSSDGSAVTIGANEDKYNLKVKEAYQENPPIKYNGYYCWSSEEGTATNAYRRYFNTSGTGGNDNRWASKSYSGTRAICISN